MRNPIVIKRIDGEREAAEAEGLLPRVFRRFGRFRLPLRDKSNIERAAALNRAERLFEVNFRSKWTR